jgi:hypothetical protein
MSYAYVQDYEPYEKREKMSKQLLAQIALRVHELDARKVRQFDASDMLTAADEALAQLFGPDIPGDLPKIHTTYAPAAADHLPAGQQQVERLRVILQLWAHQFYDTAQSNESETVRLLEILRKLGSGEISDQQAMIAIAQPVYLTRQE